MKIHATVTWQLQGMCYAHVTSVTRKLIQSFAFQAF